ncbi:MAG TPA: hemerythrin domain-containing protein [Burkholderiaceae bacterium]|nr:hemerythrin domain-containing protein [Burkholderiaceae bacterium]
MPAVPAAIDIIHDEHRALAAVLHALLFLVGEVRNGKSPDPRLFRATLEYIAAFPEKLHHPKEDEYIYRLLRDRAPAAVATLDELEEEHRQGRDLIVELESALSEYERSPAAFEAFAAAVKQYADFHWAHMRKEEDLILPLAAKTLTPEDWQGIDAAFQSNRDPLVGVDAQREFRELFRRLVNLLPAPIGLGPNVGG